MGGHGGLNILPQKRWNVYNYENREKVRQDEEAAAKEEQLKQEQVRKRDAEFRLERLRAARGLASASQPPASQPAEAPAIQPVEAAETEKKSGHINLFEGIKIFDPVEAPKTGAGDERDGFKRKKMKKEEAPKVVTAEDEKYRLGYGLAGKGVKLPWYLEKRGDQDDGEEFGDEESPRDAKEQRKKSGKKTLEELREERLKREKQEKERVRKLILEKNQKDGALSKAKGFRRR